MKKVVLASLLAVAGSVYLMPNCFAQTAVNLGTQQPAGGQVQMSADEYAAYQNATTQTTPAGKAAAFAAYLKAYPKSAVKADVLQQMMFAYSSANDNQGTLDAADQLLAVQPDNLYAYVFEVSLRSDAASKLTDPAAKQTAMDAIEGYAEKGLAVGQPKGMSNDDFAKVKAQGYPIFYGAIGADDLQKKDTAGAIKGFNSELASVPVATTEAPGPQLMDTYYLASAYYTSTPPDYLNCAFYAARAAFYAPEPFKTTFTKLGTYCYTKYHGKPDGYDAVTAVAKDNLVPPASYAASVKPAPKPADMVADLVATTPDLAVLAPGDREFALQYGAALDPKTGTVDPATGKPDPKTQKSYADEVFDAVKGKSVELPKVLVVSATASVVTVAVSDDAVQNKTADFTFNMKDPIKDADIPAVGSSVTLDGTYASYTPSPIMITMSDGALVLPKKAAPVHHTTTTHHTTH
jgi:hypothetical protein